MTTGAVTWRIAVQETADSTTIVRLLNEVNGESGRVEVQCREQQVRLLSVKGGAEQKYTPATWLTGYRSAMPEIVTMFQPQLLTLCPRPH